jgi:predicted transport protein
MSDIKLFRLNKTGVKELSGTSVALEKSLQTLIENNLETFLGIRFLATEYYTGRTHGGRIDTLGVDENCCPVIIEYKRAANENVVNQGLFYLDWLLDHKAEFKLLVMEKLKKSIAEKIEWSSPRLLCVAGDFNKYDVHAVSQMNRNIELIRYRKYDDDMLLLELVNATAATETIVKAGIPPNGKKSARYTVTESLSKAEPQLQDLYESVKSYLLALGDDVQLKTLKYYFAFQRIKNFACLEVHPQTRHIIMYLKINPAAVNEEKGFIRNVANIGHQGTGDIEVILGTRDDFEKVKYLIQQSYENN